MNKQKVNDKVANLWRMILWSMDNSDECYSNADKDWLSKSIGLVIVFFEEADRYREAGKTRSAKYIIERLRNETNVGDCSTRYQLANVGTALLAHVYNDVVKQEYFKVNQREPFGLVPLEDKHIKELDKVEL